MNIKTPPRKMEEHALVEWVYDHDFKYWSAIYLEIVQDNPAKMEELFRQEVYDIIDDAVRYGDEYSKYILDERDEDDVYNCLHFRKPKDNK